MTDTTTTYYIVRVKCFQIKAHDGVIMTAEDSAVWLGKTDEKYPSCVHFKDRATHFNTVEEAKRGVRSRDGMPWYFRIKPDTLEIFKVVERRLVEITETPVTVTDDVQT